MTFLQICYITSWHIGLKSEQKPFKVKYWKYYHWWVNMCSDVFRIACAMQQASDAGHTICLPICIVHKCIHFPGYKVHNNQLHKNRSIYLSWRSNGKHFQLILLSECEVSNIMGGECSEKSQIPWKLKLSKLQFARDNKSKFI